MIDSDHFGTPINTAALGRFLRNAQKQVGLVGEVNVLITSDEEMRRLNREFRRENKSTDVLSFPSSLNGKSGIAGDIAISAQIARANAEVLGHPLESEIKVLLLHGLLHLAGYDHEGDNGMMARLEQRLRGKLKLPASLIARSAVGKGTTSVVPSRARNNFPSSLPKTAAQRQQSSKKEAFSPVAPGKVLRSGLRKQRTKSRAASGSRTAGAKALKTGTRLNGTAEAVPSVVNTRTARRDS